MQAHFNRNTFERRVHLHFSISRKEQHNHERKSFANDDVSCAAVKVQHDNPDRAQVVQSILDILDGGK